MLFKFLLLAAVCWTLHASPVARQPASAEAAAVEHVVRRTVPLLEEPAPIHVLRPRHHPDHDAFDHSHLQPHTSKGLFFAQGQSSRHAYVPPDSRYLSADTDFKHPTVVLDHSAHVRARLSDSQMTVDFSDWQAYLAAKSSWMAVALPFTLVTTTGCDEGHFVYYQVSALDFVDDQTLCRLAVTVAEFEDVVDGFNLEFGHFHQLKRRSDNLASSTSVSVPSSTATATFDTDLDSKIGFFVWDAQSWEANLKLFAEGLTDYNYDHYNDMNIDAIGGIYGPNGNIDINPVLKTTPGDYAVTLGHKKRDDHLSKRSIFSAIGSAFVSGAGYLYHAAVTTEQTVVNFVHAAGDALFDAVDGIEAFLDGTPKSFPDNSFTVTFPPASENRYVSQNVFINPDTNQPRKAIQLYQRTGANGQLTAYCLDCGLTAGVDIKGAIGYKLGTGLTAGTVTITGTFTTTVLLGITADYTLSDTSDQLLFAIGIPGISVPKFLQLGPMATLNLTTDFELDATGNALLGGTLDLQGLIATIDVVNPSNDVKPAFKPVFTPHFQASGEVDLDVTVGLPIAIALGLSIGNAKAGASVALVDEPYIEIDATLSGSTGRERVRSRSKNRKRSHSRRQAQCNNGLELDIYLENSLYTQARKLSHSCTLHDRVPGQAGNGLLPEAMARNLMYSRARLIADNTHSAEANIFSLVYGPTKKKLTDDYMSDVDSSCISTREISKRANNVTWYSAFNLPPVTLTDYPPGSKMPFKDLGTKGMFSDVFHLPAAVEAYLKGPPSNFASSMSTPQSDPTGTTFNYTLVSDVTLAWDMVATEEGNLGLRQANAQILGNALFAVYNHVLIGDSAGRYMVYYSDEMAKYNVSRLRVVTADHIPKTSKMIGLIPVDTTSGAMLPGGVPKSVMVPRDTGGRTFLTAVCNYVNTATPSKLFIVADPKTGPATLATKALVDTVTGGAVSSCQLIALFDGDVGVTM